MHEKSVVFHVKQPQNHRRADPSREAGRKETLRRRLFWQGLGMS
jgi:hypothetical protein